MNLCIDCKFVTVSWWGKIFTGYEFSKCKKVISPVDGTPKYYCQIQRKFQDDCGDEGKWFEPRRNRIVFLKNGTYNGYDPDK